MFHGAQSSKFLSSARALIFRSLTQRNHEASHRSRKLRVEKLEDRSMMAAGDWDTSFSSDGRVLTAFDFGGELNDSVNDIAVQSNGRIVAVGDVQRNSKGDYDFGIVRYRTNGSLDTTFSGDGRAVVAFDLGGNLDDRAQAVAIASNGDIYIVGSTVRNKSGDYDFAIARLNSNGSLDTGFSGDGKAVVSFDYGGSDRDEAFDLVIQSNNRIVVVGAVERDEYGDFDYGVARLRSNGSLDTSFDGDGRTTIAFDVDGAFRDEASAVALDSAQRIVVGGTVEAGTASIYVLPDRDFGIARLNVNGSLDNSFSGDGQQLVSFDLGGGNEDVLTDLAIQANDRIVAGGWAQRDNAGDFDFAAARLTTAGSLDTTFSGDGKAVVAFDLGGTLNDRAYGLTIQTDGKIVLAGGVERREGDNDSISRGDYDFGVARLRANGSLDPTFSGDGKALVFFDVGGTPTADEDVAHGVFIQPDGRIVVGGFARRSKSSDLDFALARLLAS